jgi:hypothetical protein
MDEGVVSKLHTIPAHKLSGLPARSLWLIPIGIAGIVILSITAPFCDLKLFAELLDCVVSLVVLAFLAAWGLLLLVRSHAGSRVGL